MIGLAPHLPQSLLPEALALARTIGDEDYRVMALIGLAPHLPEVLPEALAVARAIRNEDERARALNEVLTLTNIDQSLWPDTLHALGVLPRSSFLLAVPGLVPLILNFGGVEALREVYQGIREVSRWWR